MSSADAYAKAALSHGVDASIVHVWRKLARRSEPVFEETAAMFVPVAVAAPALMPERRGIDVEFLRSVATIRPT